MSAFILFLYYHILFTYFCAYFGTAGTNGVSTLLFSYIFKYEDQHLAAGAMPIGGNINNKLMTAFADPDRIKRNANITNVVQPCRAKLFDESQIKVMLTYFFLQP